MLYRETIFSWILLEENCYMLNSKNKASNQQAKNPVYRIYPAWVSCDSLSRGATETSRVPPRKMGLERHLSLHCWGLLGWLWNSEMLVSVTFWRSLLAWSVSTPSRSLPKFHEWDDQWRYKGQADKWVFLSENVFTAVGLENDPGKT